MNWWLQNFWILLAGTIILVSVTLALVMYCICRRLLRQGKKWKIPNSFKRTQKDEDMVYENVTNEPTVCSPPLPPRSVPASENAVNHTPQENESQQPYSTVMKKTVSVPSYIEAISDYDDVDISYTYEN
ncbi:SLP adapter and CSK-interacting membrane protein [Phascolarctos cinereus]|uniref:SLP adapter and CSK-interacting membrane protein n=1 Tax=Phascolarctos cinereus TaxID=38626 RepID=A0A6P5LSF8_PHACI|nr:SLP adapter and CSK-interacting membrane protein [Phascolarctos cinereus]